MELIKVTGTVESLDWNDRGVGRLKLTGSDTLIYVKELQKTLLPKGLKKGDLVTVSGNLGRDYLFLQSIEPGEAPAQNVSQPSPADNRPEESKPPKTDDHNIPFSVKKIGPLYPILVDKEGNIIDGLHRHDANPEWRKEIVPWVQSRKDFLVARIHANLHRRTVPKKERQHDFTELANILRNEGAAIGELASKISELTGFTEAYVRMLLPRKLKLKTAPKGETIGRRNSVASQPETLPEAKVDLEEEARRRATAVDESRPQPLEDLYVMPCPACGVKLRWDPGRKILARAA